MLPVSRKVKVEIRVRTQFDDLGGPVFFNRFRRLQFSPWFGIVLLPPTPVGFPLCPYG